MQKTKYIKARMTPEEIVWIKEKSVKANKSVSHIIRSALKVYSNTVIKYKLEQINELADFYKTYRNELSSIGGNLNQTVKRDNELAVAGLLAPSYINEVLLPEIQTTQRTLDEIKRGLENVTKKAVKL